MTTNDALLHELMEKVSQQMVESLKESIQSAVEREISKNLSKALLEGEFYRRINSDLQNGLKEIYKEITDVRQASNNFPQVEVSADPDALFSEASDQLDKILQTTEQATVEIMDVVEKLQTLQVTLGDIVKGLESGGVSKDNRKRIENINETLGNDLLSIMTSLSFQDLTGQRIKRIIDAIKKIEKVVVDLYVSTGLKIKTRDKEPEKELDQVDAETQVKMSELKGPDTGANQDDVDDLLASLGL